MSKTDLIDILTLLPETCQEQAILDCLQRMFTRGEWEKVAFFLPPISAIHGHLSFKIVAVGLGVKCAIRARNFLLAIERLEMLSGLGTGADIVNARAEALLLLAIQLLPDSPTPISRLWHPLLAANLRPDTQRTIGHIGFLLASAYAKNGDRENEQAVMRVLEANMEKSVLDWLSKQLLPQSRKQD